MEKKGGQGLRVDLVDDVALEDGHLVLEVLAAPHVHGGERLLETGAQEARLALRLRHQPGVEQRLPVQARRTHVHLPRRRSSISFLNRVSFSTVPHWCAPKVNLPLLSLERNPSRRQSWLHPVGW